MINFLRSGLNQPWEHFLIWSINPIFPFALLWTDPVWLNGSSFTRLKLHTRDSNANSGIPTLRAWTFACKCPRQSQSRWMKTDCSGSCDMAGILLKPWMRPSHRCLNQETACVCKPKTWSQRFKGKIPRQCMMDNIQMQQTRPLRGDNKNKASWKPRKETSP